MTIIKHVSFGILALLLVVLFVIGPSNRDHFVTDDSRYFIQGREVNRAVYYEYVEGLE